jgi:hypothetical protein
VIVSAKLSRLQGVDLLCAADYSRINEFAETIVSENVLATSRFQNRQTQCCRVSSRLLFDRFGIPAEV